MSPATQKRLIDAIARCLAVVCLIALIFATFRLFNGADTPFLAFSVMGAAAVQLANRPRKVEILVTVTLAAILAAAYMKSGGVFGHFIAAAPIAALAFLGLASTLVLGWKACLDTQDLKPLLLATFCPALVIFTNVALAATIRFQPQVFDLYLYRFDGLLGPQVSFTVGRWFANSVVLQDVCFLIYSALPLAEVLILVLFVRGVRMPANPLATFVVAGLAGFVLYQVCPGTGPAHVFGPEFPNYPPPSSLPMQPLQLDDVPRNAIPSLHSAWALLIFWSVRECKRWIRVAAAVFLALTLLATLGLGEHYVIDLVVALPFAAAVLTACKREFPRALALGALTTGWLIYIRFGLPIASPPPGIAWIAVLVTLAAPLVPPGLKILPKQTQKTPGSYEIPSADKAESPPDLLPSR